MKKRCLMLGVAGFFVLTATVLALAGEHAKHAKRHGIVDRIGPLLELTDQQKEQLKPAADKFDTTMEELRAKMKAANDEFQTELEKVLTPEQKQKRDEMKKAHRPGGEGQRPQHPEGH